MSTKFAIFSMTVLNLVLSHVTVPVSTVPWHLTLLVSEHWGNFIHHWCTITFRIRLGHFELVNTEHWPLTWPITCTRPLRSELFVRQLPKVTWSRHHVIQASFHFKFWVGRVKTDWRNSCQISLFTYYNYSWEMSKS